MTYRIVSAVPGLAEYQRLRAAGGLSAFSEEAAGLALKNSWFAVSLMHDDRIIGMGRIVGDGGCFFQIVDIVVEPAHQGKGLGKEVWARSWRISQQTRRHRPMSA